jgi:uncharacterized protein (DUF2267 family)
MMSSDAVLAVMVAVLVTVAGFLAIAETGLTRMGEARAAALEAQGRRGGRALTGLVRHPERFLGPLLLMVLACQLVAATLVGVLAERHLGPAGIAVAAALEVAVLFVFAEAAPKTWAIQHHDRAALLAAPPVRVLARRRLLRLPTRPLVALSNVVLPGRGLRQGPFVSEAELLATADLAAEAEAIEPRERSWIRSIIDFGDTVVREVMVPRPDMVTVPAAATVAEALELAVDAGLSRLPALHIPAPGETATCGDHMLRAERVRGRRVTRIRLMPRAHTGAEVAVLRDVGAAEFHTTSVSEDVRLRPPSDALRQLMSAAIDTGIGPGQAGRVVHAVLSTFLQRLPEGERRHVIAHLPPDVHPLAATRHRVARSGRPARTVAELTAQVMAANGMSADQAGRVIAAVLGTLRVLVPEEAVDVASVLPPRAQGALGDDGTWHMSGAWRSTSSRGGGHGDDGTGRGGAAGTCRGWPARWPVLGRAGHRRRCR